MSFNELLTIRKETVDGVSDWVWIKQDNGAWDGPANEWPEFKKRHLKYCTGFKTVIQAGAALGMYPRLLSDYFDHVYAFEPDYLNFHCAVNNCQKPNIHLFNSALGNNFGLVRVELNSRDNSGMHRVVSDDVTGNITCIRVDDLNFSSCDLLMLDVEGFEGPVIDGARETIMRYQPLIQTELARGNVVELLSQMEYVQVDSFASDVFWLHKSKIK